ncbi:hypothetical protein N579_03195 [Corynebacterium pseudodiphtheriticum 090104]|nr:hypothetical protein N579_03195 [Corynebacterium pseudodiphtheriticum 090104]
MNEPEISNDDLGEFVIYTTDDGRVEIHLRLIDGSVWLAQKEMAELFSVSTATINAHLKNIYADAELSKSRTIRQFLIVQTEGDRDISREISHYNLDAIMAVGFRVRGPRGAQFRRWATKVLREYLIKASPWTTRSSKTRGEQTTLMNYSSGFVIFAPPKRVSISKYET